MSAAVRAWLAEFAGMVARALSGKQAHDASTCPYCKDEAWREQTQ